MAGFITSITWIAFYLSFAANACGAAVNSGALCAGDWTALMANFGEMATAACSAILIPLEALVIPATAIISQPQVILSQVFLF